jgi:hypothetical protein
VKPILSQNFIEDSHSNVYAHTPLRHKVRYDQDEYGPGTETGGRQKMFARTFSTNFDSIQKYFGKSIEVKEDKKKNERS